MRKLFLSPNKNRKLWKLFKNLNQILKAIDAIPFNDDKI